MTAVLLYSTILCISVPNCSLRKKYKITYLVESSLSMFKCWTFGHVSTGLQQVFFNFVNLKLSALAVPRFRGIMGNAVFCFCFFKQIKSRVLGRLTTIPRRPNVTEVNVVSKEQC